MCVDGTGIFKYQIRTKTIVEVDGSSRDIEHDVIFEHILSAFCLKVERTLFLKMSNLVHEVVGDDIEARLVACSPVVSIRVTP